MINAVQLGSDYQRGSVTEWSCLFRQTWCNHTYAVQASCICCLRCCFLIKCADFHPRRVALSYKGLSAGWKWRLVSLCFIYSDRAARPSCFTVKLGSHPKHAFVTLKTIPETWTHTLPALLHKHALTDGKSLPVLSRVPWITSSFFICNCLSDFQKMILFPVCLFESLKPISSPGRASARSSLVGLGREDADCDDWEDTACVTFNLSNYIGFEKQDGRVGKVEFVKGASSVKLKLLHRAHF